MLVANKQQTKQKQKQKQKQNKNKTIKERRFIMEKQKQNKVSSELVTSYISEYDQTVIFEYTYAGNEIKRVELVGWYFGKPDADCTKNSANRNYVCDFDELNLDND